MFIFIVRAFTLPRSPVLSSPEVTEAIPGLRQQRRTSFLPLVAWYRCSHDEERLSLVFGVSFAVHIPTICSCLTCHISPVSCFFHPSSPIPWSISLPFCPVP